MLICDYCGCTCDIDETTPTTDDTTICCMMCGEDLPMCATCGKVITDAVDYYEEETGNHYCGHCH